MMTDLEARIRELERRLAQALEELRRAKEEMGRLQAGLLGVGEAFTTTS